eukprot:7332218-Pyramimonas_sp.AAC.1
MGPLPPRQHRGEEPPLRGRRFPRPDGGRVTEAEAETWDDLELSPCRCRCCSERFLFRGRGGGCRLR